MSEKDFMLVGETNFFEKEFEIQKNIFALWFESIRKGPKRRSYKVPSKIEWLPCNCTRIRTNESDPNNEWHIKRNGEKYIHVTCGQCIA